MPCRNWNEWTTIEKEKESQHYGIQRSNHQRSACPVFNPIARTVTEEEIGVLVDALGYLEIPEKG